MLHEYKDQTEILILCYTNTSNETGVIKIPNPRQTDLRLTDPRPCLPWGLFEKSSEEVIEKDSRGFLRVVKGQKGRL